LSELRYQIDSAYRVALQVLYKNTVFKIFKIGNTDVVSVMIEWAI